MRERAAVTRGVPSDRTCRARTPSPDASQGTSEPLESPILTCTASQSGADRACCACPAAQNGPQRTCDGVQPASTRGESSTIQRRSLFMLLCCTSSRRGADCPPAPAPAAAFSAASQQPLERRFSGAWLPGAAAPCPSLWLRRSQYPLQASRLREAPAQLQLSKIAAAAESAQNSRQGAQHCVANAARGARSAGALPAGGTAATLAPPSPQTRCRARVACNAPPPPAHPEPLPRPRRPPPTRSKRVHAWGAWGARHPFQVTGDRIARGRVAAAPRRRPVQGPQREAAAGCRAVSTLR